MDSLSMKMKEFLPKTISSEEMAAIDENSAYLGIPTSLLMENAGVAIANYINNDFKDKGKNILIIAGTGNNGGDGFVAARHLANLGYKVTVNLLGKPQDIRTNDAKMNWDILTKLNASINLYSISTFAQLDYLYNAIKTTNIIVDAILGTGLRGALREPIASVAKFINESDIPIVAIDTPTGLNPSTGEIHGIAIKANLTITFHRMKNGFSNNKDYSGKIFVSEIGIPLEAELFTGPGDVRRITVPRDQYSHKGDHGWVLVIGGSETYTGAPALAGLAALRSGAGLVMLAVPNSAVQAVKAYSPDLIIHSLSGDNFNPNNISKIEKLLPKIDSLILGPGLGLNKETQQAVCEILELTQKIKLPIVVDADGIKALKNHLNLINNQNIVLTPHPGEFEVITGIRVPPKWEDKYQPALQFAEANKCVLLLKGNESIITDGSKIKINNTGNPGLAVAGTGDVLSGIIGTYLAKKQDPFDSAVAGAWIHGEVGNLVRKEKGYHLLASDLLDKIPLILKAFDK